MKKLRLVDFTVTNGALSGVVRTTTQKLNCENLTIILDSKAFGSPISHHSPIKVIDERHFQFTVNFHAINISKTLSEVSRVNLFLKFQDDKQYELTVHSFSLKNKIHFSLPVHLEKNEKVIVPILQDSNLSLLLGSIQDIAKYRKTDKTIISNVQFNHIEQTLSFILENHDSRLMNAKIIMVERNTHTKWVEDIHLNANGLTRVNLKRFLEDCYNKPSRWDFYLAVMNHLGKMERSLLGIFNQDVLPKKDRYFTSTHTKGINIAIPYFTEHNSLSLVIMDPKHEVHEKIGAKIKTVKFTMKRNLISGKVLVDLQNVGSFHIKSLVLKHRSKTDPIEYEFPVIVKKKNETACTVMFYMDLSNLNLENYYWDFYLSIESDAAAGLVRMNNPSYRVRKALSKKSMKQSYIFENNFWVHPYITASDTIALLYKEKEIYESSWYFFKERLAYFIYILFNWYFKSKNIWLAFEKFSEGAQDNAFYFFEYCYKQKKKKHFYYIIKKNSPDYVNVLPMKDKVIHFMSFKYMIYMFASRLFISSESKGHAYDIRTQKGLLKKALNHKRQVFLQHGVIALKKVDQIFKKTSKNGADLFVVSSEFEKQIIKNNFGYKDKEIIVTGLSRWDVLEDRSNNNASILLMPTWRSWMDDLPEEKFMNSQYYQQYISLLNSSTLENMLEEYDIDLNFFIHPKFKAYINKFSSKNKRIKIFQFGEAKVNELLMKSSMLITDYSSVSWDMYYQKKPVIFYQFDCDEYLKYQGSYLNMETELFGDRAFTVKGLIDLIKKYAANHFKEELKYAELRTKYFKYTDHNNSSRIYQEIRKNAKWLTKRKYKQVLLDSALLKTIWTTLKRNETSLKLVNNIKKILIEKN